jgi:hypothetical protein
MGGGRSPRESENAPAAVAYPVAVEASGQPAHDQQQESGANEGHDNEGEDAGAEGRSEPHRA